MQIKPYFNPPLHLQNAHIQSILNSVGPRKFRAKRLIKSMTSETLIFTTDKGVRLKGEFDRSALKNNQKTPSVAILIHGWEGSSQSAYVVTTAAKLLASGLDVLRLNLRDHGDTQHLNRGIFNSTMTDEVADCIQLFTDKRGYLSKFLVGFSLGGNFTLRIAADRGEELGLTAAVAICPPVDPVNATETLNRGLFVYQKYFMHRWKNSLRKKIQHFPEYDFGCELERLKTIDAMNQYLAPKLTNFPDVISYLKSYSLTGDRLQNLTIPSHLIASANDPIIPIEDIAKINCPSALAIEVQSNGGHCGFINRLNGESWIESYLVELLQKHSG